MNSVERLLLSIPSKFRFPLLVLVLVPAIILLASLTTDIQTTWLVTGAMLLILFLARPIWLPPDHGTNQIRKLSLQKVDARRYATIQPPQC
ncbi:MAG: hypothetical protein HQL87_05990 [Magnetococcales bacterium]|nr:hypothetical protein [Magnetococcales bacterium]